MAAFLPGYGRLMTTCRTSLYPGFLYPSTTHMLFEVLPSPVKGCVHLESEPQARVGRGRVASQGQPSGSPRVAPVQHPSHQPKVAVE